MKSTILLCLILSSAAHSAQETELKDEAGKTLGRRDLANHISCVRDAYLRLKAKGYHLIYREFNELGDRTYHPVSNDDALAWALRQRNKKSFTRSNAGPHTNGSDGTK